MLFLKYCAIFSFCLYFCAGVLSSAVDPCPQLTQNLLTRLAEGGEQPPLDKCAQEAMAVVPKGVSDQAISDWYYYLFLFDNGLLPQPIRELKGIVGLTQQPILQLPEDSLHKDDFNNVFKDIVSDPIGRILLYRLLLEIYRYPNVQSESAFRAEESYFKDNGLNYNPQQLSAKRSNLRLIRITYDEKEKVCFSPDDGRINLSMKDTKLPTLTINHGTQINNLGDIPSNVMLTKKSAPRSVVLFHEMLHWFHYLLIPNMVASFSKGEESLPLYTPLSSAYTFYEDDIKGKRPETVKKRVNVSTIPWTGSLTPDWKKDFVDGRELPFNQEEFLTICGTPASYKYFIPGLEISENLFRLSKGLPFRFGHRNSEYLESGSVIGKLLSNNLLWYYGNVVSDCSKVDLAACFLKKKVKDRLEGLGQCVIRVNLDRV